MSSRASAAAWPLLVAGCGLASFAAYAWLAVRNPHVGLLADDALYLLMAEMYSPYRDAVGAVFDHVRRYSHLPSFYPLLMAVAGGGPEHLAPARVVTAACMALAWLMLYAWLRQRGAARAIALAWAMFCAWTPATLLYAVDLWSEGLYVLLALGVLVCEAGLPRRPSALPLLGLAVLVACAMQTRSIGIALLPAVLVGLSRRGAGTVVPFIAGLATTLVAFRTLAMGTDAPSYPALLLAHYAADPVGAIAAQLGAVARALPGAALYDFFLLRELTSWQWPALVFLLFAALRGLWLEARAGSVIAVYVAGYVAIALTWPFPEQTDRFLYPLLPVLCLAVWRGTSGRAPQWSWLPLALAVALAAPGLSAMVMRAATPLPDGLDSFRSTRYWLDATRGGDPLAQMATLAAHERAGELVASQVPADACVYTQNVHLVLLRGRRAAFLPPPPARMAQGPPWGCAYFLLSSESSRGLPAFYPLDHLRARGRGLALVRRDAADPRSPPVAILMRAN